MTREFKKKPSTKYLQAVDALRDLLNESDLDMVKRAYAEAVSESKLREYIHGIKAPHDSHVCVSRLKGKRCPDETCNSPMIIPRGDHYTEWRKDGKTIVIVSQPYGMSYDALKHTVAFCDENGLTADISADQSWHFPGATLLVEYKRAKH